MLRLRWLSLLAGQWARDRRRREVWHPANEDGFITSAPEASAAAEYCGRPDVGAEPGFWAPWLVVEYALFPAMAA